MKNECDSDDRKGLTESPCDDASRYTDGTLRLCLKEIARERRRAARISNSALDNGETDQCTWHDGISEGLRLAAAILRKHTKEKHAQQEAGG